MLRRHFMQAFLSFAGVFSVARPARATLPDRLLQCSPLAGFRYHEGAALWPHLQEGHAIDLVREPDNPHDERAVRVMWRGGKLGYLPRDENHAVAQLLERGERLDARIAALKISSNPWERIRIDVLLPSA